MSQTVEAVLISGPRRGEIIELTEQQADEWTEQDVAALNNALDDVIRALDRLSSEMDRTIEAFRKPKEVA